MDQEREVRYVTILLRGGNVVRFITPKENVESIVKEIQDFSEVGGRIRLFRNQDGELETGYLLRDVAGFQISSEPPPKRQEMDLKILDELIKEQLKQIKEGDDWKDQESRP